MREKDVFYVKLNDDKIAWVHMVKADNHKSDNVRGTMKLIDKKDFDSIMWSEKEHRIATKFIYMWEEGEKALTFVDDHFSNITFDHSLPTAAGISEKTADIIDDMFLCKEHLNDFCQEYYNENVCFDGNNRAGIIYTTTEDSEHDIEIIVDMNTLSIECIIDSTYENELKSYRNIKDMREELVDLCYSDLLFDAEEIVDSGRYLCSKGAYER